MAILKQSGSLVGVDISDAEIRKLARDIVREQRTQDTIDRKRMQKAVERVLLSYRRLVDGHTAVMTELLDVATDDERLIAQNMLLDRTTRRAQAATAARIETNREIRALNTGINEYRYECEQQKGQSGEVANRRYRVLSAKCFDYEVRDWAKIAEEEHISERQARRDFDEAVKGITEILLGVDGFIEWARNIA